MKLAWLLLAASGWGQVNVPRPAPELEIVESSGRTTKLSSYRGDVVLLGFIVTSCSHCQAVSREFEKLQTEFGPRGFHVAEAGRIGVGEMRAFLGLSSAIRVSTPQVVLIDRIGMIRAQSAPEGTPMLQSADVLRGLIQSMLGRHSIL
jgi:hypothetical protein